MRLDQRESMTADRGGYAVVVPGDPDASELLRRVTSDDPDVAMPPRDSHREPLSAAEADAIREWIRGGAVWGRHWSFEPPERGAVPFADRHPIDAFVDARLEKDGLSRSHRAATHVLARRLAFDLTGLPPAADDVRQLNEDASPAALEQYIEQLLSSPHYGERMAMWWLDAARYADTDGFQQDATRTNWPWRDWVVQAFNDNMPFDQFTIEQFAGDLLPDATPEQILATCFHRNHMTNGEGGRDPEESRVDYVIDRVNTMGTVWLGLTLGCCQCHSHKFDPLTQADYYSLSAFFNSVEEDGKAGSGAKPFLKYRSTLAQRAVDEAQAVVEARMPVVETARRMADAEFNNWLEMQRDRVRSGFQAWHPLQADALKSVEGTVLHQEPDGTIQASGPHPRQDDYHVIAASDRKLITGLRLEVFPHPNHSRGGYSRGRTGEFILTDVKLQVRAAGRSQLRDVEIASAIADVEKDVKARNYGRIQDTLDDDPRNGWTVDPEGQPQPHVAIFALATPLQLAENERLEFVLLHRSTDGDSNIGRFRVSATDQPGQAVRSLDPMPLEVLAQSAPAHAADIADDLRRRLHEQFLTQHSDFQTASDSLARARRQLDEVKSAAGELNVMVLAERDEPRTTWVLERGVWDQHGEEVLPLVPREILRREDESDMSRRDLAAWLVDRRNPLTARVIVNQLWQNCFGAGLVRTPEDFGLQGELPTHPELLDWLAVELMESGWDVKHLLKLILTSATYQQSGVQTAHLQERDPDNRLLARGARFRLPAWMIRDAALATSGLLNPSLGGPPVLPYQPEGVWEEMFMGRFQYQPSQGPAQFRRTVYAFWRRSAAPTFLFDSAQRRTCEVRPRLTNTPLQALTLLNDLTLREAARELAVRLSHQHEHIDQRLSDAFHAILFRPPRTEELVVLRREFNQAHRYYSGSLSEAEELLSFGQPEHAVSDRHADVAALMLICSLVYNLDEAMTHE